MFGPICLEQGVIQEIPTQTNEVWSSPCTYTFEHSSTHAVVQFGCM